MDREKEARAVAWRGVGSVANPANPRGVAIRAELEWRGVGALREFGIAWTLNFKITILPIPIPK